MWSPSPLASPPGEATQPIAIGVVEDSDEDFNALLRAIRRSGTAVEAERWMRAEDVLAQLEQDPPRTRWPRLMLIDLNLPGVDGVALVERLRAELRTRPLPLFILSGSARHRDVDRGYAAGASLYLRKPLTADQIKAAIELLRAAPPPRP